MNGDGQLDYAEFTKYLSIGGVSERESEPVVSTNTATYLNRTKVDNHELLRPASCAYTIIRYGSTFAITYLDL